MIGNIFSIEEFSVYDGPGIRTTVFLKGCPLRCNWCHNPEGQLPERELAKRPSSCKECGNCLELMKNNCNTLPEEVLKSCPYGFLRICGEEINDAELCDRLLKNENILKNGGGITFSGGEPLLQSEFVFSCLAKLKNRLHTAIQTSGFCDAEVFEKALNLADYFLFDLKLIDEEKHIKYTGESNKQILHNFGLLAKSDTYFTVRTPLIPGITDTVENLTATAELLKKYSVRRIELLPYNKAAGGKYKMVFREYSPVFDESCEVNPRTEIFNAYGIETKVL